MTQELCETCDGELRDERCLACEPYEIEYCLNDEWLVVFGPYEADANSDCSMPSPEARELLKREIRAVKSLPVKLVPSKGQRCLCHGWNGAQFSWSCGQFGTFEDLPAWLVAEIEKAIDSAQSKDGGK